MGHVSLGTNKHVDKPILTRRSFVGAGALVSGMLALAGCSWTPRNAQTSQGTEPEPDSSTSAQANSIAPQADSVAPADVSDGLTLVSGGTFGTKDKGTSDRVQETRIKATKKEQAIGRRGRRIRQKNKR